MRVVAKPFVPSNSARRILWAAAAVSLLVGIGAGGLALWPSYQTPLIASIDLASGSGIPPDADQLIVTGWAQRSRTVVLTETIRGSTFRTAFTPLTSPDWTPLQPIRFVMRVSLGPVSEEPPSTLDGDRTTRFGPAVPLRHELPGVVRASLNRGGVTIAADAVLLDENLESAGFGLWIVAFFGCVLAVALGLMPWLVARAQARARSAGGVSHRPPRP